MNNGLLFKVNIIVTLVISLGKTADYFILLISLRCFYLKEMVNNPPKIIILK